jgi:hypothetical protein
LQAEKDARRVLGNPDRAREQPLGKLHGYADAGHRWIVFLEGRLQPNMCNLNNHADVASVFDDDVMASLQRASQMSKWQTLEHSSPYSARASSRSPVLPQL